MPENPTPDHAKQWGLLLPPNGLKMLKRSLHNFIVFTDGIDDIDSEGSTDDDDSVDYDDGRERTSLLNLQDLANARLEL